MLRRLAARLLLLAFSLGLSLLIAEAAVRMVRPQAVMTVSRGLYVPDPPRRYRLQPGFRGRVSNRVEFDTRVAINREGLRGPEIGLKTPGTLRVLVLGDSFAFGVGAREVDTYPARLQEILRSRGVRAEVLNAGAPGYGVPDETAWYERWGKPLAPDVILVTVFIGNDLQDAVPGPKPAAVDGALVMPGETAGGLSRWLYYHSQLFVLIKNSSLGASLRRLLGRPEPLETRQQREEFDLYAKEGTSEMVRQGAAETERAVAGLAAAAGKARVLAVIVPSLIQVDPRLWQANLQRFGLDPARYDPARPNGIFRGIFARHGIPVLDLTGPFSQALARGQKIYYSIDQHLTPAGYRLAAERIGLELARRGAAQDHAGGWSPRPPRDALPRDAGSLREALGAGVSDLPSQPPKVYHSRKVIFSIRDPIVRSNRQAVGFRLYWLAKGSLDSRLLSPVL